MTANEIQRAITDLGWQPEHEAFFEPNKRATCGNFSTPYRDTWEDVLNDVNEIKRKGEKE